jgi:membrane-associated phospholipid phosphatase
VVFLAMLFISAVYHSKRIAWPIKGVLILIALGIVGAVAISRVSLGEHWTSDVIGGGLFGVAVGIAAVSIMESYENRK